MAKWIHTLAKSQIVRLILRVIALFESWIIWIHSWLETRDTICSSLVSRVSSYLWAVLYAKHWFTRESLGRMYSSVYSHPILSGARLPFQRQATYWGAVGSDGLKVVCNHLYFQGDNRKFHGLTIWLVQLQKKRIWRWSQPFRTAVLWRGWESVTLPCAQSQRMSTVMMSCLPWV